MLNNIEDKVSKIMTTPITLFNNLSNSDLVVIAEAGELKNFCNALTLDIITEKGEENTTYEA
jgi:hypothetical protein